MRGMEQWTNDWGTPQEQAWQGGRLKTGSGVNTGASAAGQCASGTGVRSRYTLGASTARGRAPRESVE